MAAIILQSYEVDFQHKRITLRPVAGSEITIDRTALIKKLTPEATRQVDKNTNLENEVRTELEQKKQSLRRVLATAKKGSPEQDSATKMLTELDTVDLAKLKTLKRNRVIAETAATFADEQLEDYLKDLQPKLKALLQ